MGALTFPATLVCTKISSVTFLEKVRFNFTYSFMLYAHALTVTSHVNLHNKCTLCASDKSQGFYILAVSLLEIAYTTFGPGTIHPDSDWHDENHTLVILNCPRHA
jgi:hypothetical protein